MYFPYVRGKQFELIGIRELCSFANMLEKISPVIEPVKPSSTLGTTLCKLAQSNFNFNIIINPEVGDLQGKTSEIIRIIESSTSEYDNYQLAIIINQDFVREFESKINTLIDSIEKYNLKYRGITLIHKTEISSQEISYINSKLEILYNLIYSSKTSRRYYREFDPETLVSLDDYFEEQQRNVDYLDHESNFSDEYRFYKKDGFVGFSDFLTIGDNYSESGFLPRAVAIHISYIDNGKIKVKHFVSDSNEDTSNIGGKFSEAIDKLVEWCDNKNIQTEAVKTLKDLQAEGHFPGLGTLKKLSIMNHIELVINNI